MHAIFEAARWAASAYNEQPWRFVIVSKREDPDGYARMLNCLRPANREWAASASCLILTVARERFTHNDAANRHALHDVGLATASLWFEAIHQGLECHPMAGFEACQAQALLDIPDGFHPVTVIAVGYLGDASVLPERLRDRELQPRLRRPLEVTCFSGRWGQPARFCSREN